MRTQQDLLYSLEEGATKGHRFETHAGLETWVRVAMLDQPWWHERFPLVRGIRVPKVDRRGDGSVGSWRREDGLGTIEMSPTHWCELFVCHEVAHVTAATKGSTAHCPVFARDYLTLVYLTMGSEAYVDLHTRFVEGGVEIG